MDMCEMTFREYAEQGQGFSWWMLIILATLIVWVVLVLVLGFALGRKLETLNVAFLRKNVGGKPVSTILSGVVVAVLIGLPPITGALIWSLILFPDDDARRAHPDHYYNVQCKKEVQPVRGTQLCRWRSTGRLVVVEKSVNGSRPIYSDEVRDCKPIPTD